MELTGELKTRFYFVVANLRLTNRCPTKKKKITTIKWALIQTPAASITLQHKLKTIGRFAQNVLLPNSFKATHGLLFYNLVSFKCSFFTYFTSTYNSVKTQWPFCRFIWVFKTSYIWAVFETFFKKLQLWKIIQTLKFILKPQSSLSMHRPLKLHYIKSFNSLIFHLNANWKA